jgi:hypothetical protein
LLTLGIVSKLPLLSFTRKVNFIDFAHTRNSEQASSPLVYSQSSWFLRPVGSKRAKLERTGHLIFLRIFFAHPLNGVLNLTNKEVDLQR